MKIICDISVLGLAERYPSDRAGITRVVENTFSGLAELEDCDLLLYPGSSFDIVDGCIEYIETNPRISSYPLLFAGWRIPRRFFRERRYDPEVVEATSIRGLFSRENFEGKWRTLKIGKRTWRRIGILGEEFIENYFFPLDSRRFDQADIFHSPFGPIPERARRAIRLEKFLTLYDMIPVLHPELFTKQILKLHADILESLQPNDWVLCISNATKNDFLNHVHFDPSRIFVTPLAASSDVFFPSKDIERFTSLKAKYEIPDGPYILTLNKLEPRKNIELVISSFIDLIQSQHIKDLSLVLVGGKGWAYDKIFDSIANAGPIRDRIVVTGYVPDADLAPLYSNAMMFVYPSLYEGFGLPPLEAMQCGVPVITSNTSSFPEVVGEAAVMIDPADADALSQSMYQLYCDEGLRKKMSCQSLERARKFSWAKCVADTLAAYRASLAC